MNGDLMHDIAGGMLDLMDDVYYWVCKLRNVGKGEWLPREGYTTEDCLRRMQEVFKVGTLDGLRRMVEAEKKREAKGMVQAVGLDG